MKIIAKDNFDRETVSEWVVAENVNDHMAEKIVKLLNSEGSNYASWFYKATGDDYTPYTWEP